MIANNVVNDGKFNISIENHITKLSSSCIEVEIEGNKIVKVYV